HHRCRAAIRRVFLRTRRLDRILGPLSPRDARQILLRRRPDGAGAADPVHAARHTAAPLPGLAPDGLGVGGTRGVRSASARHGHRRTRTEYCADGASALLLERGLRWATDFSAAADEVHALYKIREWGEGST